jgi:hypothetical protein
LRIDDQVRTSVAFLAIRQTDEQNRLLYYPVATAFFVGVHLGGDRWARYAVTAKHVVDKSRPQGSLWIRAVRPGRKVLFEMPPEGWSVHPTSDVALARVSIPLEEFGMRFIPTDLFATREWLDEHHVGPGDHVVFAGLFTQYSGPETDEPVVRFGRISLLPRHPIEVPASTGVPAMSFEAVLVETISWGGESGSPAWVYFSVDRDLFAGEALNMRIPNPRLLGLHHGHYNVPATVEAGPNDYLDALVRLNAGIGIVVPAFSVLELLMSEPVVSEREQFTQVVRAEGLLP